MLGNGGYDSIRLEDVRIFVRDDLVRATPTVLTISSSDLTSKASGALFMTSHGPRRAVIAMLTSWSSPLAQV